MKKLVTFLVLAVSVIYVYAQEVSPYISKVYDFQPAPGQFINVLPLFTENDTKESMITKVEDCIVGEDGLTITLGAYGGYVVFGFDHPVVNVAGGYDFKILGNAFLNSKVNENGGCEPGIVMVSHDANGNGIPDDEWYELAGSEYNKPETIHNYEITYYKPAPDHVPTPDNEKRYLTDTTYIKWTDNQGGEGYVSKNTFHAQSYWPEGTQEETITYSGTKLADNGVDEFGDGSNYILYAYDWGYADNFPNADERSGFKLDWAVDKSGSPVYLPEIHFVKVYTGVNQYCGALGEISTEISGAIDLHPDALPTSIQNPKREDTFFLLNNPVADNMQIVSAKPQIGRVYTYSGTECMSFSLESGTNTISCDNLKRGVYILVTPDKAIKFIKK